MADRALKVLVRAPLVIGVAAFTAVAVARADTGMPKLRLNARDNASARAVVVKRTDLGPVPGWKGGMTKAALTPVPSCPGYRPKQSDLVVTGLAESHFSHPGLDVRSVAQVLQTAQMVRLDWQRSLAPGVTSCLRSTLIKQLSANQKLTSFARVAFPQVASFTASFRALIDATTGGKSVRVMIDFILAARGRSELTLTVTAPAAGQATVSAAEARLARLAIGRVRT
jgi:hypothetical protein